MALVVIKTYTTRIEAEIQKGLLEANGVKALVTADDEGGAYPFPMQPSSTGVKLMVSEKDLKKAQQVLNSKP